MNISNPIRKFAISALVALPLVSSPLYSQNVKNDTFEREVPTIGTDSQVVLSGAPNPHVNILGEDKIAKIVVNLSENVLYKYDNAGNPEKAYLVASGKKTSPTHKGVRIVTHTETFPYKTAYGTKRKRNPKAYGPKIICLNIIDPKTGAQSSNGEFIHGNNDVSSLGKYASLGCIRMDNEIIKELALEVERGDIVIIE